MSSVRRRARRTFALVGIGAVTALAVGIGVASALPSTPTTSTTTVSDERQKQFAAAASEYHVPDSVLLAVSYAVSGWTSATTKPDRTGGFGLMHLTDGAIVNDGRGDGRVPPASAVTADPALHTLPLAAKLASIAANRLKAEPQENLLGGAALLAHYATEASGGKLPTSTLGWYGAIAKYGTGGDAMTGRAFADDVFAVLRSGVPTTVVDGERLRLAPVKDATVPPSPGTGAGFAGETPADCPTALHCRFVPAADTALDQADATAYGNLDPADRPADLPIEQIVLQSTTSTYDAVIAAAQQPTSYQSTHYVVRASDGQVTQLVQTKDIAWYAANWTVNSRSVGITIAGDPGDSGYPLATYQTVARLVSWLSGKYEIDLDRQHLLAADEVIAASTRNTLPATLDATWNWTRLLDLAGAPIKSQGWQGNRVVAMAAAGSSAGASGVVGLRAEPRDDAPLVSLVSTDPGSTTAVPATAEAGQSYPVAEQRTDWTAIWYGAKKVWFHNTGGALTVPRDAVLVTPAPGRARIPVYRQAVPSAAELATGGVSGGPAPLLEQTIPAGQAYLLIAPVPAELTPAHFARPGRSDSLPSIVGSTGYLMIRFDSRIAFVAAADVQVSGLAR